VIRVTDLVFQYPGTTSATVRNLDFDVESGEIFGFLGPSGAGKSTTQRVLTGLLRDYQGEVSVLGWDLHRLRADFYERIGVSFEIPNLYDKLTALENLRYYAALFAAPARDPMELLDAIGLADAADVRAGQLSKGMRVRLGFVRALLNRPELLFLDEPTAGMDPGNALLVKDLIRAARRDCATVFLTTHDMVVADDLCDRVAFMVEGELACIDQPRALKLEHGRKTVRVEIADPDAETGKDGDGQLAVHEFALADLGKNAEFLALLREHPIETLHSQETTLEEVFLKVTGKALA
jgi:fluoroquinolone transport system ATP-binding protein